MNPFERKIAQYISQHELIKANEQVIVGISGGADSVVLLFLLKHFGYNCIAAHCNFQLRQQESDDDEKFVQQFTQQLGCPLYTTHFDTQNIAKTTGVSIEMAARNLRYQWFETLRQETNSQWIAVAHHANDLAETVLLNITRGTGLKGLTALSPKREQIIRPLLCVNRKEIETYAQEQHLTYRIDSTNQSIEYSRNRIRHNVIPELEAINPSFIQTMQQSHMIWSDIQAFLQKAITQEINAIVQTDTDQRICISTTKLKQTTEPRLIAFEMLRKYNFNADTVAQLMQSIDKKESGKRFLSKSHEAIIDREHIIISPKASLENPTTYTFEHLNASFPEWLQLTHGNIDANFQIKRDRHIATFDADAIQWPLTLRHWQEGDCFKPFGMQGMQKVSDLLINNKIDCQNKKKIWILCDATKILWVVGIRTDGRAAITNKSKQYIEFHTLQ